MAIKRLAFADNAIASQNVCAKTIRDDRKMLSVASKVLQQMVVKVGGALWHVGGMPPGTMICGFDVSPDPKKRGRLVFATGESSVYCKDSRVDRALSQTFARAEHRNFLKDVVMIYPYIS
jgi:hypothetical protein